MSGGGCPAAGPARIADLVDPAPHRAPQPAPRLPPRHLGGGRRGPELAELRVGIATIFICHTSASLTLNENASPDVRADFGAWFDRAVPDGAPYFSHTLEGPDDMPAHVKASLTGSSLVLPVADGRLALGVWQGIYLCEHRDGGGSRRWWSAFGEP